MTATLSIDPRRRRRADAAWDKWWRRRPRRWTPWLVIRHAAGDVGVRPLADGVKFWESPDVWVESSDSAYNAVAGEPNYVYARVSNTFGKAPAVPLRLDFYWGDPSLALSHANMTLIGTEWVELDPLRTITVRCTTPWVPIHVNGGHECLIVNCSNPLLDPITNPFHPTLDRHAGQRNVTVLHASAGGTVQLPLWLYNPWPMAGDTLVRASANRMSLVTPDRQVDRALVDEVLALSGTVSADMAMSSRSMRLAAPVSAFAMHSEHCAFSWASPRWAQRAESTGSVAAELNATSRFVPNTLSELTLMMRLHATHAARPPQRSAGQPIRATTLAECEQRQLIVEFTVPHDARRGEFIVHRLSQFTNDVLAGGYTLVLEIV